MTWEHPGSTPKPVTLYMCVVQVNSRRGKKWGRSLHRCSFINGTVILRARTRAGGAAGRASVDTLSAKKWWRRLISDWLHSGGGKMCWIPGASPAAAAAAAAAPHFQPSISLAQWCRTRTTASALRREWAKTFFFFGKGAGAVIEAAHKPPNPPKKRESRRWLTSRICSAWRARGWVAISSQSPRSCRAVRTSEQREEQG